MRNYIVIDGHLLKRKNVFVGDLLAAIFTLALICGAIALVVAVYGPNLT